MISRHWLTNRPPRNPLHNWYERVPFIMLMASKLEASESADGSEITTKRRSPSMRSSTLAAALGPSRDQHQVHISSFPHLIIQISSPPQANSTQCLICSMFTCGELAFEMSFPCCLLKHRVQNALVRCAFNVACAMI